MAQKKLTTHNQFNANWTERDEAVLIDLMHRKIGELKFQIRNADSPGVKNALRSKRKEYKSLLRKLLNGSYDSNIVAAEMASAKLRAKQPVAKTADSVGKYADAYGDIDFDFKGYFSKTRYYGTALPIISLVLMLVFILSIIIGTFIPQESLDTIEYNLNGESRLSIGSIGYFKIAVGETDFRVPNDGLWPKGTFENEEQALSYGQIYRASDGSIPDYVYLAEDLHMTTIDITNVDVIRALFRTPLFSDKRLDIIEDLESMQGRSWYYYRYLASREDEIKIEKGADGKYDGAAIVRHIATYGTIVFLCLTIVFAIIEVIFCIGRLFSFTSRRLHAIPIFTIIFGLLTLLCPVFLEIETLNMESVSAAFDNYFILNFTDFVLNIDSNAAFNLIFAVGLAIPFIVVLLPLFMRNRRKEPIRYVPKGNRPHTFPGQPYPTKAGQAIPLPSKKKAKKAAANGSNPYVFR